MKILPSKTNELCVVALSGLFKHLSLFENLTYNNNNNERSKMVIKMVLGAHLDQLTKMYMSKVYVNQRSGL